LGISSSIKGSQFEGEGSSVGDEAMIQSMLIILAFLLLMITGLWVRFRPVRMNPSLGVDNWYWLLCIEDVKKNHRIPARLPYFMLEIEEQWYPPLYSFFMSFIPLEVLKKNGGRVAQFSDLLTGCIIYFAVLRLSDSIPLAFISGFSYVIAFLPLSYSNQLQPRGLANALLSLAVFGLWFYTRTGSLAVWSGILVISVILLFLHKMTTQIWWVYLLGFGTWARDLTLPILLPASIFLAIIISKGFYIKVLNAHWDIVTFWNENIQHLGSHQYYESPQYWKEGFVSTAVHQKGLSHQIRKLWSLLVNNIFILLLPACIYFDLFHSHNGFESFLWWWLGLTYLWCLLTTFAPYFKALGSGIYYLYQSFLPLFLLAGNSFHQMSLPLQWGLLILWAMGLCLSGVQWEKYCRSAAIRKSNEGQRDLYEVLNYLKELPKDGIFCIPFTLPDITAYWTHKKVFWGGHGYGFHTYLKPYFPIMRQSVLETLREKSLNYVLFWRKYLDSLDDIGLKVGQDLKLLVGKGEYELYEVVKR
jgi:hypothetical protein